MSVKLISPPSSYPVSLEEAKAHLNVDFDDDDALIEIYRKAATEDAEKFTGQAFIDQTWDWYADSFPSQDRYLPSNRNWWICNSVHEIRIPKPPLIEILGVFYRTSAGDEQQWDAASYVIDAGSDREPARITLANGGAWPVTQGVANAVRVRFRAGYIDEETSPPTGTVPYAIKAAILLGVGELYANREIVVIGERLDIIPTAEKLLRRFRVEKAMA